MTGMGTAMDIKLTAALVQGVPNVAAFCRDHKISRQTYYKWRRRFATDGVDGLADRSRRPAGSPHTTPSAVEDEIAWWRKKLADDGEDNGPQTIQYRMLRADADPGRVPSRTTIWRVLVRRGLITPEPNKRPRSSLCRFTYQRPNECWQSDWTGWALANDSPVAISGVLDDCSRYLCALHAEPGDGTADGVWATMTQAITECGIPAMSLTDNGLCYSGHRHGRTVAFETNLRALGVNVVNSSPYHPQTCGKIERFWQTLKKWLRAREAPETLAQLQRLLDEFREHYNQHRPHRALRGATPAEVFTSTTKARPAAFPTPAPQTITTATVYQDGRLSATGAMINVGRRWAGHTVTVIRDGNHTVIISGTRLVRELTIDPTRTYQRSDQPRYDLRGHREPTRP